jgi:hypothetical protein
VSPWHGVPLKNADGTMNFICEIPKETKAKMEVATDEDMTPIKQARLLSWVGTLSLCHVIFFILLDSFAATHRLMAAGMFHVTNRMQHKPPPGVGVTTLQ